MDRVKLSRDAKAVFRLLHSKIYTCPKSIPQQRFNLGALELHRKGLAHIHQEDGGDVLIARLSEEGKTYILSNPNLLNPIDWKWVIPTILTAITAITTLLLLFIACSKA